MLHRIYYKNFINVTLLQPKVLPRKSPTKYKFKIFFSFFLFHTPPHLPTIGHETLLLFFISQGSNFQSSMNAPTVFKNIYIASISPSHFSFFFFFRILPISKWFPHCNFQFAIRTNFFFLPFNLRMQQHI